MLALFHALRKVIQERSLLMRSPMEPLYRSLGFLPLLDHEAARASIVVGVFGMWRHGHSKGETRSEDEDKEMKILWWSRGFSEVCTLWWRNRGGKQQTKY